MALSRKKSRTTNKEIIVEYGTVKIAEIQGDKIKVTQRLTKGQTERLYRYAFKNKLKF
jgi:hypothetical protein